jgi:hypothetical protein
MYPEQTPYIAPQAPRSRRGLKIFFSIVGILLLTGVAAGGVYAWQNNVAARKEKEANAKIASLEESLAKAKKAPQPTEPAEVTAPFVVEELGIQFTNDSNLVGLSYSYDKASKRATFTTSQMLTALTNVPGGKGREWLVGDVMTVMRDTKANVEKAPCTDISCPKENILATVGEDYIYKITPANSPGGTPGFEAYDEVMRTQPELLQNALKTAKALDS